MTRDQRIVGIGAVSGVAAMGVLVWALSAIIGAPELASRGDRIAYALQWLLLPAIMLFAMLAKVGNARFFSEAIDPTLGKENQRMTIDGRVADNTLQQLMLFVIGVLALAVSLPDNRLSLIPAATITFVIARLVFWIGYRIHPLYRAPGFSSTAYLNAGMLLCAIWLWLS